MVTYLWCFVVLGKPLTINEVYGRKHYHQRAAEVKRIRSDAFYLSMEAGMPVSIGAPIKVTSHPFYRNERECCDVAAEVPMVKAVIDSFVDRGCIPDDTRQWVKQLNFLAPEVVPKGGVVKAPGVRSFSPPGVIITVSLCQ